MSNRDDTIKNKYDTSTISKERRKYRAEIFIACMPNRDLRFLKNSAL